MKGHPYSRYQHFTSFTWEFSFVDSSPLRAYFEKKVDEGYCPWTSTDIYLSIIDIHYLLKQRTLEIVTFPQPDSIRYCLCEKMLKIMGNHALSRLRLEYTSTWMAFGQPLILTKVGIYTPTFVRSFIMKCSHFLPNADTFFHYTLANLQCFETLAVLSPQIFVHLSFRFSFLSCLLVR